MEKKILVRVIDDNTDSVISYYTTGVISTCLVNNEQTKCITTIHGNILVISSANVFIPE